ncbi:MAG: hypothetical protein ACP5KL_04290, partial [Thermoplasmata archaeon]
LNSNSTPENVFGATGSGWYTVNVYSVTGTHYLAAGDTISIGYGGVNPTPLPPGTTVTFTYNGNVIYKYTA